MMSSSMYLIIVGGGNQKISEAFVTKCLKKLENHWFRECTFYNPFIDKFPFFAR